MKLVEKLMNKLGIETKEQKANRIAFERFRKANFNYIYNKVLQFVKDDELMRNGLMLSEEQLRPRVYARIDQAIYDGVINQETFELAPSMEIC